MSEDGLLEPSFADAIAAIEQVKELPPSKRTHWCCSLRMIAKALERPPRQLVVARGGRLVERLGQHAVGLIEATESDQERRVCEQGLMHALPE